MADLELEARLWCSSCDATPFLLYRRRLRESVAYEHVLWPNGSGVTPPPAPERLLCPSCGTVLARVAA